MEQTLIRPARPADIPQLLELCQKMAQETNFKTLHFDQSKAWSALHNMIDNGCFVAVAERDGVLIGGMIGFVSQPWYSTDLVAHDVGIFVDKDSRGGRLAIELVKTFTEWAKASGAKQIRPGVSSGVVQVGKIYERFGYEATGSNYLLEV